MRDAIFLFTTLTKFISKILVLPHSSANVVGLFSRINLNKTKHRNFFENYLYKQYLHTKVLTI